MDVEAAKEQAILKLVEIYNKNEIKIKNIDLNKKCYLNFSKHV